ncbi:unnamed protein product [Caenorhabditis nigoni]
MVGMMAGENIERYNCSGKTEMQWMETGKTSIVWGVYYLATGLFFQIIGWPILMILMFKMGGLTVHRILAFIGFVGIIEIWGNSIWPGISVIMGTVYCSHPFVTTFFGKLTMVQWVLGSTTAIFLGIHRLSNLFTKNRTERNWKTIGWFTLFVVYSLYGSLFYDTVLFNSRYMAPLLNPQIDPQSTDYTNYFLRFHNITISIALVLLYGIMAAIWTRREHVVSSNYVSRLQASILTQSIIISATYAVPAICFVLMYYIKDCPAWFTMVADLSYQLSGGLPFITYICLNQKIRKHFFAFFLRKNPNQITVSVVSSTLLISN